MTHYEVLQYIFTEDIARCIMRFHSHPVADMLHGLIKEWHRFKLLSTRQLLGFNNYYRNKRMLKHVIAEERYCGIRRIDHAFIAQALTHVPFNVRHPEYCQCAFCQRYRTDLID